MTDEEEVVRRRIGHWRPHTLEQCREEYDVCSVCGIGVKRRTIYAVDNGKKYMSEESYSFCPWCGSRILHDEE